MAEIHGRLGLDKALRNGELISFKSLDSALLSRAVLFEEETLILRPWLARADRRSVTQREAAFGFGTGPDIAIKGEEGEEASNVWKRALAACKTYYRRERLPLEDVQDAGVKYLDAELALFAAAYLDAVNAACFTMIQAAAVASAGVTDVYSEVAVIETSGAGALASTDVDGLIIALPAKHRRDAVFAGNSAMASKCRALRAGVNGACLWSSAVAPGLLATFYDRPFVEDDGVEEDCLIFGSPSRASGVAEQSGPTLVDIERLTGDYRPYIQARAAAVLKDARAVKILDIATT